MANQKIRIKLKAYEHTLIDQSAERIVETAKRTAPAFPARFRSPPRRKSSPSCARPTSTRTPASSSRCARTSA